MTQVLPSLFIELMNMSITACFIALAVIVLRRVLKKAPKKIICLLWAFVGFRLVCPFSFESVLSLIPSRETIPQSVVYDDTFRITSGIKLIDSPVNNYFEYSARGGAAAPVYAGVAILDILCAVWLLGVAAMLMYMLVSYLRVRKSVSVSVPFDGQKNVFLADSINTAFIFGVIKPKIYLPSNISDEDISLVLAHENAHIKRLDYLFKPLAFLLLSVYWFNPLMWLSFALLCRDIEAACDERVLAAVDTDVRHDYSKALIRLSVENKKLAACPLAFGETGVKERVKNVLNYKKPTLWIIIVAVVASAVVAVCFLTNPKNGGAVNTAKISEELDEAVHLALLADNRGYRGECPTEGHIVLYTKEKGSETSVYTIYNISCFGFGNDAFYEFGGSMSGAVLSFYKVGKGYELMGIEYPQDGSDYSKSIRRLFAPKYRHRVLDPSDKDRLEMWNQCVEQAQAYLDEIGRTAKICDYGEYAHDLFPSRVFGISAEIENALSGKITHLCFNYEQSDYEQIENGIRYVYSTEYDRTLQRGILTKYEYETKKVVEYYEIDVMTADFIDNPTVPSVFTPCKNPLPQLGRMEYTTIAMTYYLADK